MLKQHKRRTDHVCCIFVHAGAGYHSIPNEGIHLQACNEYVIQRLMISHSQDDSAAAAAMALLRNGGSAVDAVEMAIKVLEDREITNAGYGSNLTMDGVVECDAVIVNHYGQSGGAGAVAREYSCRTRSWLTLLEIKNPISLARSLLNASATALSLRRVPPNFLVGQGATDFAYSHGIPVVPHDAIISPAARERWKRWKADLVAAQRKFVAGETARNGLSPPPEVHRDSMAGRAQQELTRRQHAQSMEAALYNEGQPISPPPSEGVISPPAMETACVKRQRTISPDPDEGYIDPRTPPIYRGPSSNPFMNSTQCVLEGTAAYDSEGSDLSPASLEPLIPKDMYVLPGQQNAASEQGTDGMTRAVKDISLNAERRNTTTFRHYSLDANHITYTDGATLENEDHITDTVGAIAIDSYGNIACGASSGGIGMKHRGRVGPAALVGVGASLIPAERSDPSRLVVATVTSGTGEHMATTQAAHTCSNRIFNPQKRNPNGELEEISEDEALRAFIEKDFMDHPSVHNSTSAGAIGVMSVKASQEGAWIFFGHNTDSFALANMSSLDARPVTTMSRSQGGGTIAQGGRAIRFPPRPRR